MFNFTYKTPTRIESEILPLTKSAQTHDKNNNTKKERAIRIRYWLDQQPENNNQNKSIPWIYLPSEWVPPLVPPQTEQQLFAFESELRKEMSCRRSNIDFFQNRALKILRERTNLQIGTPINQQELMVQILPWCALCTLLQLSKS
jgi:hypothetical protein